MIDLYIAKWIVLTAFAVLGIATLVGYIINEKRKRQ